jgi:ABC-type transport system involved in multi-copper enzyme maturation permease subunit
LEDAPVLPGPIFNMELLTSARRTRYFFIRALYATVLLIALGLVYQSNTYWISTGSVDIRFMARISAEFFGWLAGLQLVAVVLLGPAMVAGAIATERERRTIEYLFASSLSNSEIVLGKLAARMVHVVYLVLTGVPIFALMMLMGGIAPESLLALTIITLCTVLTISTLSIAISVWSTRAREAVTRTYLLLFALAVIPSLLSLVIRARGFYVPLLDELNDQFVQANPFAVLTSIVAAASGNMPGTAMDMLWTFARNHLILSALLATLATLGVRRAHLKQTTKAARRQRRLSHWLRPSVGDRPMLWKEIFAEPAASRLGWVGRIAAAVIVLAVVGATVHFFWVALTEEARYYRQYAQTYLMYDTFMGAALATGGLLLVAARAAGSISSERERDCWVSLISTPLEPREIVWAKILGSIWSIRGVAALLLFIWGLTLLLSPGFMIVLPFLCGTFLILAFYAAALGVRYSLWCRSSMRAMAATLATGLFVGGIYLFCCMTVMIAARPSGPDEGILLIFTPCVPFLLGFPSVAYSESDHMFSGHHSEGPVLVFAYILGNVGYLIAAVALTGSSIGSFDWLSGRTRLRSAGWMPIEPPRPSRARPVGIPKETAIDAVLLPPEESV